MVLVEWLGLRCEERSWEDLDFIQRLLASDKLADKLLSVGGGNVTIELDIEDMVGKLKDDLRFNGLSTNDGITGEEEENSTTGLGPLSPRPT